MKEARVQAPSTSEVDEVRYFAYGANMNRDVFVRRRRFHPLSTERATLSGYELLFAARGMTFVEPVFAALRAAPDGCVHGVLYRLRRDNADRLHRLEDGYERLAVDVRGVESGVVGAYTYNIPQLTHGLVPSRRYLGLLCDGARDAGLPNEYVATLARHPSKYFPILSPLAAALAPLIEAALLRRP
jgi:hypothetical protein